MYWNIEMEVVMNKISSDIKDKINFDSNPPVELNEYDSTIKLSIPGYESIFTMAYSILHTMLEPTAGLLIVGAGTGKELCDFGTHQPQWLMTAVDPSSEMLSIAKEKVKNVKLKNRVVFHNGYTNELSEDQRYNAATSILVMHFLPDDGMKLNFLKDIAKRLQKRAPLILVDLFGDRESDEFNNYVAAWKIYAKTMGIEQGLLEDEYFSKNVLDRIHFISQKRVEELLTEAGFERISRFSTGLLCGGWIAIKS